jgi:hypothetical protein
MKKWVPTFFITILLFSIAEIACYYILKSKHQHLDLFYRKEKKANNLDFLNECCGYDKLDPLLGWAMSEDKLKSKGFTLKDNCVFFSHYSNNLADTLRILITGGSTSDVGLYSFNWPTLLFDKLKKTDKNIEIFDAAVGAYSSSQEVLKLLRDGLEIKPTIHISYCGVNEEQNPNYVSPYEQKTFEKMLQESKSNFLFPNLTYFVKSRFLKSNTIHSLQSIPKTDANHQWKKNMKMMHDLATVNGYVFIGILQPAVGVSKIEDKKKEASEKEVIAQYKHFYPNAIQYTKENAYMLDFTTIFDSIGQAAFLDDCHVKEQYQHIISDKVLILLKHQEFIN